MISNSKMSFRQAMFLSITMIYQTVSSTVPFCSAYYAKQAAWISPIISMFFIGSIFIIYSKIYRNYVDKSIMEILYDNIGRLLGNIILIVYLMWFIVLLAMHVKYYAERLLELTYTNTYIGLIIGLMLVTVAVILRSGITIVGRMNDIFFIIVNIEFFGVTLFDIPNINLKNVTPITHYDLYPIFKGSIGVTSILSYILFIFFISDKIDYKDKIKKQGIITTIFISISTVAMIFVMLGMFSYKVMERMPEAGVMSVKQLTLIGSIGSIEGLTNTIWLTTDFVTISFISAVILNIIKAICGLKETKSLINPFLIFIYFFSLFVSASRFELDKFWSHIESPISIIMQIFLPILIFSVGKIKKKI